MNVHTRVKHMHVSPFPSLTSATYLITCIDSWLPKTMQEQCYSSARSSMFYPFLPVCNHCVAACFTAPQK